MHCRKAAAPLSFLLLFLTNGCGGSGSSTGSSNNIGGTINATDFIVPAGTTETVTSDLKVLATGNITIAGTLLVDPGVSVDLFAEKKLAVTGAIKPAIAAKSAKITPQQQTSPKPWIFSGATGSQVQNVTLPGNAPAYITGSGETPGILYVGPLTGTAGADATMYTDNGAPAPNIEIGTLNAIQAAKSAGKTDALQPSIIQVTGAITGGAGGKGYTDSTGTVGAFQVTAKGSNGGAGGSIFMAAQTKILGSFAITGGQGGAGGGVDIHVKGVGLGAGKDLVATLGNGGPGGSVTINFVPSGSTITPGQGGQEGSCDAGAGEGGANGGAGGNLDLTLGGEGADGGSNVAHAKPPAHATLQLYAQAGDGGGSNSSQVKGGNGGDITVQNPYHYTNYNIGIYGGNGGSGWGTCTTLPLQKATVGGNGGIVDTAGLPYSPRYVICFYGGRGGDGIPAAAGGAAGKDITGKAIGKPGVQGTVCGSAGLHATGTIADESSEFSQIDSSKNLLFSNSASWPSFVTEVPLNGGSSTNIPLSSGASNNNNVIAGGMQTTRAAIGSNLMYVSSAAGHAVLILDETQGKQVGTIPIVGSTIGPNAIGYNASNGKLYVTSDQGVNVYDTTNSNQLVATITAQQDCQAMAINPSTNRLYLLASYNNQLIVVDTSQNKVVTTIALPAYAGVVALNPTTNMVYVPIYNSSSLVVINGSTNTVAATINVGPNPWGVVADSQRNHVYVANYNYSATNQQAGSVTEIDGLTNTVITTVTVGKGPTGIGMNESTDTVYVSNAVDKTVSVLTGG